ncbi:MAG: hypothetical protein AAF211_21985, partial [Myxococcota bacterium]
VSGNTFAGVWVADAVASLTDVDVDGNGADPDLGGGVGVGAVVTTGFTGMTWVRGRATGHPIAPVYVSGEGNFVFEGVTLEAGPVRTLPFVRDEVELGGHALVAVDGVRGLDGSTGLTLTTVTLADYVRPGLLLVDAEGFLSPDVVFEPRPEATVDVQQQDCDTAQPIPDVPGRTVVECAPAEQSVFFERVVLPLPPPESTE